MADHPVKVPEELAGQLWFESADKPSQCNTFRAHVFAQKIAEWAADQELEACIDVLSSQSAWDVLRECTGWKEFRDQSEEILRAARRTKPPTLAEQGMEALNKGCFPSNDEIATIRVALNRLAELEAQQ